uniref:Uncharacterized protein n=1 Tax=Cacopsylla melanoneura TaxID=428564 RepID=A0A8D9ANM0_9HEMI
MRTSWKEARRETPTLFKKGEEEEVEREEGEVEGEEDGGVEGGGEKRKKKEENIMEFMDAETATLVLSSVSPKGLLVVLALAMVGSPHQDYAGQTQIPPSPMFINHKKVKCPEIIRFLFHIKQIAYITRH